MDRLNDIVKHFAIEGEIAEIKPLGSGLINDTYKVTTKGTDTPDYVLQRINHHIFTDVDALQRNITAVTRHLRRKLEAEGAADIDRRVLHFLPTVEDASKTYFFDGENYWRVMTFIPDALTFDIVNPEYSRHAGRAFGKFQADLVDIPETLVETIPDFHNMEFRLQQLREAIARLPEKQRLVFNMRYYDDMKYEKMSEILGTSVGALKASYHLAVKKIEQFFADMD